jgi:spermidine synthase
VADIELRKIGDNLTIGPWLQSLPVPPNSDFFPFVDLNAPRLRYMRQNALELPALTLLPIPFLELLDRSTARAPTVEPSPDSPIVRDRLVRRALEISTAVSTGSLNDLDPLSALYLSHIDLSAERCADKAGQKAWSDAVRNISDETAAYLNAVELQQLWSKVRSSPCYRTMTGSERTWADLLAAISQRDAPQIVRLGTELIGPQTPDSEQELAYLTTVTAAAYLHLGQIAAARSLLDAQLGRIGHAGQFDLALRDLVALTR